MNEGVFIFVVSILSASFLRLAAPNKIYFIPSVGQFLFRQLANFYSVSWPIFIPSVGQPDKIFHLHKDFVFMKLFSQWIKIHNKGVLWIVFRNIALANMGYFTLMYFGHLSTI